MSLGEVMEDEWRINEQQAEALAAVLQVPGLSDRSIDSLFADISHVRSPDGRLCIFEWAERTGGTFHGLMHVVFYRDAKGAGHGTYMYGLGEGYADDDHAWSHGGGYDAIHALGKLDASMLYVLVGGVHGCTTCCSELLTVVQLGAQGINFNYPAFETAQYVNTELGKGPTWELTSRCGDVTRFVYDPAARTVHFTYNANDLTPVWTDSSLGEEVSGKARFDGRAFVFD